MIADDVVRIFNDCLYRDSELEKNLPPENAVMVHAVMTQFGFHPGRLESHRADVRAILERMPNQFKVSGGGGWSFLQLCADKDGHLWGEHLTMEMLVALSIGLKLGKFLFPRELWDTLPGGMPYVQFEI